MSNECIGIYRKRPRRLYDIGEFQAQRSAQSDRVCRDLCVEIDDVPRFQNRPVAFGEGFIARLQRSGEDLGNAHRGDCKAQSAGRVRFK